MSELRNYISSLYQNNLGRDGFALEGGSGIDFWENQINQGVLNRDQLRDKFANSDEAIAYRYAQQNQQAQQEGAPPVGLIGQEAALDEGYKSALESLDSNTSQVRQDIQTGANDAMQTLNPSVGVANNSNALLEALSGAGGNEAQAQAFSNFQQSPGQEYLRNEAERALTRNSAATGKLGSGTLLKELQSNAVGLASQDFDNQFNRVATTSQLNNPFIQQKANIQQGTGQAIGNLNANTGLQQANFGFNTGQLKSNARGTAGQLLANLSQGTGQNIANIGLQQGNNISGLYGNGGASLAGLISQGGQLQSQQGQNLLNLLAGVNMTQPNLQNIPGTTQTEGQIGKLAEAGANAYTAYKLSDIRLKTNIKRVKTSPMGYGIYEWDWIDPEFDEPTTGVIAQELRDILPNAVSTRPDGFLGVDYSQVVL